MPAREKAMTHTRIHIPPVGNMTEVERLTKLVEVLQNEKEVITKCREQAEKERDEALTRAREFEAARAQTAQICKGRIDRLQAIVTAFIDGDFETK